MHTRCETGGGDLHMYCTSCGTELHYHLMQSVLQDAQEHNIDTDPFKQAWCVDRTQVQNFSRILGYALKNNFKKTIEKFRTFR